MGGVWLRDPCLAAAAVCSAMTSYFFSPGTHALIHHRRFEMRALFSQFLESEACVCLVF